MPILRALIVLLVVPFAHANELDDCDGALGQFSVPRSVFARHSAFASYTTFLPDFEPWIPSERWIVGRNRDRLTTWRLNLIGRRMIFERKNVRGAAGQVNLARHAARAALAAHAGGMNLDDVRLSFTNEGSLLVELPMTKQGTEFVIALQNRVNHVRDFTPIDLLRWPSFVDRLPRTPEEYDQFMAEEGITWASEAQSKVAPARRRKTWRTWLAKLAFWRKKPADLIVEPAPEPTLPAMHDPSHARDIMIMTDGDAFGKIPREDHRFLPAPKKIRAFSDEQVAFVSAWLETQFPGLHVHAFARTIRYDLPTPQGMVDVVAHARRISQLVVEFARPSLDLGDLAIAVSADLKTFTISGIPYDSTGAMFLDRFAELRADETFANAPVVIPGLDLTESERVRTLLEGLEPTILYSKGETAYFVRPPDPVPPTVEELEAIHQAKGGALPRDLRLAFATLTRNEVAFASLAPWTHEPRPHPSQDDLWTAQGFGCDVTINVSTGRISYAFEETPRAARERVERILASLFSTKDRFDFSSLKLELGQGTFSGRLILTASIERLATRILTELRTPLEIDGRDFTEDQRERATAWFQEQYDDARAARGGAPPVRTAAE